MDISRVRSKKQVLDVVNLACQIWTDHYVPIIGQEQVDYMLRKFQSERAIAAQCAEGYEYYIVSHDGNGVGYMAIVPDIDADMLMISKIYVLRSGRGHGFGRAMLEFAQNACKERRIRTLWLTVNKNNGQSIAWYNRMGFKNVASIVQDIGAGFVMDDYRMEKAIGQQSFAGDDLKPAPEMTS